jgi:hypothetical protein
MGVKFGLSDKAKQVDGGRFRAGCLRDYLERKMGEYDE